MEGIQHEGGEMDAGFPFSAVLKGKNPKWDKSITTDLEFMGREISPSHDD